MADLPICEAFGEMGALAERMGVVNINRLDGCWEVQLDKSWAISVNGHDEPTDNSAGHTVPPFHIYIEYNGWPAGLIGPSGGTIAAGSAANEDSFIAALKAYAQ